MSYTPSLAFAFLAICLTAARGAGAAEPTSLATTASEDNVIVLPKYEISTDRVLPPIERWHYVSIPGFEILSNASERNTKLFVEDFYLLRQVAQSILPTAKEDTAVPTYIVLCGEGNAFETFMPDRKRRAPPSLFIGDTERAAIVINFTFQSLSGDIHTFINTNSNDPFRSFYLQYFRQLVRNSVQPAPPRWVEEGLVQIFAAVDFSPKTIVIGKVGGESEMGSNQPYYGRSYGSSMGTRYEGGGPYNSGFDSPGIASSAFPTTGAGSPAKAGSFNKTLARRPLIALAKFFSYDPKTASSEERGTYAPQAYLFTHLCLYGRNQRFAKPYFNLALKAAQGPITEETFKQCFGFSFKEMEKEMRSYISFTDYKAVERRFTKGSELELAPKFTLRDATDAESSRIAGEVLRLAGHKQEATNRLIAPYVRGQYDADLLAALGLAELSLNHTDRSRRFLEAAAKANTTRSRAYFELAQQRYHEAEGKASTEKRSISEDEFVWVQAPLYQALKHPPALASVYDLLARTWYFRPTAPTKEQFEQLAAGAQKNYKDLGLVYRVAALGLKHGYLETSQRFTTSGLANSPDESTKAKFEQLAQQFPTKENPSGENKPTPASTLISR
ncbi:MAG: hypothetical protein QM790_07115 [Nibricoccus sp.]